MMDEVNERCHQLGLEESSPSLAGVGSVYGNFNLGPKILKKGNYLCRVSSSSLKLGPGEL